jgi:hypothetical protein
MVRPFTWEKWRRLNGARFPAYALHAGPERKYRDRKYGESIDSILVSRVKASNWSPRKLLSCSHLSPAEKEDEAVILPTAG